MRKPTLVGWYHVADTTSGTGRAEETVSKAWWIAGVDYGRTRADAAACLRVFFVGVLAVEPTSFRAGLGDVSDLDLVG